MSGLKLIDAGEQPKKMTVDFVFRYADTGEESREKVDVLNVGGDFVLYIDEEWLNLYRLYQGPYGLEIGQHAELIYDLPYVTDSEMDLESVANMNTVELLAHLGGQLKEVVGE
ncbi:hypothetical protein [Bacillus paralicheniformis]|uniref:hypothetical protein n=1 Tax=Bacillus paralicheniformis TaxID=1648923 RepID=UPI0022431C2C|nr:hypothetical protein [Bacillus paralicheniformis]MEC1023544.1 hypothetical protein [Bacillus paralicheniformis]MEC1027412.1 hypothetical protein [Bacillus paralicheniformis]MEC1034376.1 hypothetical protein [Bacillus paralicheniformis]MEC1050242.1 hypothetical protein [Bacillus paralicheniformis]MEC1059821.1 hypothetical protein [Bacillus paralicheniformis]